MKKGNEPSVNRSSSGLEEVSGKKQLSLRGQSQKPVLKVKHKDALSPTTSSSGTATESPSPSATTVKYSHITPPPKHIQYPSARQSYVLPSGKTVSTFRPRSPSSSSLSLTPTKNRNSTSPLDPYSHPMSSNRPPSNLFLLDKTAQKSVSITTSSPSGLTTSFAPLPAYSHVQKNSFLRPQSELKNCSVDTSRLVAPRGSVSLNVNPSESNGHATFENNRENVDPTKLLRKRQLHDQLLHNYTEPISSQKKPPFPVLISRTKPQLLLSPSLITNRDAHNSGMATLSDTTKVSSSDAPIDPEIGDGQDTGISKLPERLSTPLKYANSPNSLSKDLASKVRNLNYTPSKPYDEVSTPPSSRLSPAVKDADDSPRDSARRDRYDSDTNSEVSCDSHVRARSMFYRKASKDIEAIVTTRQRGDKQTPSELLGTSNGYATSEAETEEETDWTNVASPSGERLPGDGEACSEQVDDEDEVEDDDEALDDLEDDVESDGRESDSTDMTSICSNKTPRTIVDQESTTEILPPTSLVSRIPQSAGERIVYPALTPSLFSNIAPTIHFVKEGERVERLSWEIRKLLKWRLSPITPNIIKAALARVGFRITKKSHDWLGCWGKHMKAQAFKSIRDYQKLNHFPGTFQLGRKDRLWRNLCKMQLQHGRREFNFFPQTYVLPFDMKMLKRNWEENSLRQKWIIKPPASARGIGVRVIHKWSQLPRRKPIIVQRYLSRPFLINDSKFDMRIYVYVSCYDPLRIYVFDDGLARFASCKYSGALKSLNNRYMHLTNYSINKKNTDYQSNSDDKVCQGHKWSLKSLWIYLRQLGVNSNVLWENIKDLIIKTIICAEPQICSMVKANIRSRYTVHELFGFDILLDENLKPWILEVNISPSLHSNSPLDINIKGQMIKDLFNIAGFHVPDKADVSVHNGATGDIKVSYKPSKSYCHDKRLYTLQLAPDEKAKHAFYTLKHNEDVVETILDRLTPSDVRVLTESIDEDSRKGMFQRIFPTPSTHKYMKFFEHQRYYNLLLDEWVNNYNRCEMKGICLLESLCQQGYHLQMSSAFRQQWSPPMCHPESSVSSVSLGNLGIVDSLTSPQSSSTSPGTVSKAPKKAKKAASSAPLIDNATKVASNKVQTTRSGTSHREPGGATNHAGAR